MRVPSPGDKVGTSFPKAWWSQIFREDKMLQFESLGSQEPDYLAVLIHGYGADGHDLIGLANPLAPYLPKGLFLSPHAPHPVAGMGPGREWFPLQSLQPREFNEGVVKAAPQLTAFLGQQLESFDLSWDKLLLIGFSQGTMMSLEVGLRLPKAPLGIIGFSGALPGSDRLADEISCKPPVLLVHGDADPVVPVDASQRAHRLLQEVGVNSSLHISPNCPHSIAPDGLAQAASFIQKHI